MRYAVLCALVAGPALGAAPMTASAQTIVDLSQPQSGKSRFMLNSDFTPADLGVVIEDAPERVAVAPSRIPACGEGCKMTQPVMQAETTGRRSRGGVAAASGAAARQVAGNAHQVENAADKKSSTGRRGRRR